MPKTFAAQFCVAPGKRIQLAKLDPRDAAAFPDREEAEKKSKDDAKAINSWQDKLFAEGKRALLIILQGTDTSGKDGTIRHVFNETGPWASQSPVSAGRAKRNWRTITVARTCRVPAARHHRHLQPLAL